jgi:hypothetical protein
MVLPLMMIFDLAFRAISFLLFVPSFKDASIVQLCTAVTLANRHHQQLLPVGGTDEYLVVMAFFDSVNLQVGELADHLDDVF